jgi:hypothetical protein
VLVIKAQKQFKHFAEPSLCLRLEQSVGDISLPGQLRAEDSAIGTLTSMVTERLQHTHCIPINSHLHWTNNIKSSQFRNITYQTCTFLVLCNNLRKM